MPYLVANDLHLRKLFLLLLFPLLLSSTSFAQKKKADQAYNLAKRKVDEALAHPSTVTATG